MVKNSPCNAGDMGSLPGWGTKIPQAAEQLSLQTTPSEPLEPRCHTGEASCCNDQSRCDTSRPACHNYWSPHTLVCVPQPESMPPNKRLHTTQHRSHMLQLRPDTARWIFKSFKFIVEIIYWNNLSYQTLYCVIYHIQTTSVICIFMSFIDQGTLLHS